MQELCEINVVLVDKFNSSCSTHGKKMVAFLRPAVCLAYAINQLCNGL